MDRKQLLSGEVEINPPPGGSRPAWRGAAEPPPGRAPPLQRGQAAAGEERGKPSHSAAGLTPRGGRLGGGQRPQPAVPLTPLGFGAREAAWKGTDAALSSKEEVALSEGSSYEGAGGLCGSLLGHGLKKRCEGKVGFGACAAAL